MNNSNSSIKILFISQYFYPETFKGNDIVFDFVKRGYEVTVLTAKPNYPQGTFFKGYSFWNKSTEFIDGVKVIRTPIYPRKNGKGLHLVLNYISFVFFSYFTCLFRIRENYDVIFVQQLSPVTMALPGLWLKRKCKSKLYLWVLDLWPESVVAASAFRNKHLLNLINKLVKYIYNSSDVILVSSNFFKQSIIEKLKNKNKEIIYFPNWAEDVFTENKKVDYIIPEFPNGFNIVFAGNIGESQDFESILKAAELTIEKKINWIIIGDGRKKEWVENQIKKRKIVNVRLMGRFEMNAMPSFFAKADAMLVALKDEPVFALTVPAKIQAYMASGKIILGMLNGEGQEIINQSKCGYAVDAGNYKGLVEKAIFLRDLDFSQKLELQNKSKEFYLNNFSKEKLFNELEVYFNQ